MQVALQFSPAPTLLPASAAPLTTPVQFLCHRPHGASLPLGFPSLGAPSTHCFLCGPQSHPSCRQSLAGFSRTLSHHPSPRWLLLHPAFWRRLAWTPPVVHRSDGLVCCKAVLCPPTRFRSLIGGWEEDRAVLHSFVSRLEGQQQCSPAPSAFARKSSFMVTSASSGRGLLCPFYRSGNRGLGNCTCGSSEVS